MLAIPYQFRPTRSNPAVLLDRFSIALSTSTCFFLLMKSTSPTGPLFHFSSPPVTSPSAEPSHNTSKLHPHYPSTPQNPLSIKASTQAQATPHHADLSHLADATELALVFGVVPGAIERAGRRRVGGGAFVDGRVRGGAHVKLGELVVFDLVLVAWVAFAFGFDRSCLLVR